MMFQLIESNYTVFSSNLNIIKALNNNRRFFVTLPQQRIEGVSYLMKVSYCLWPGRE